MKKIIYRNKNNKPIIKKFLYFINEKITIIKYLHEMTIHKRITTLYKLNLKQNFIWYIKMLKIILKLCYLLRNI